MNNSNRIKMVKWIGLYVVILAMIGAALYGGLAALRMGEVDLAKILFGFVGGGAIVAILRVFGGDKPVGPKDIAPLVLGPVLMGLVGCHGLPPPKSVECYATAAGECVKALDKCRPEEKEVD